MYQRRSIHTADDVRAVATAAGSHYFDADTMRFFSSRLLSGVWALDGHEAKPGRRYLFLVSNVTTGPREYTVAIMTLGNDADGLATVNIDRVTTRDTAAHARTAAQEATKAPMCPVDVWGPCGNLAVAKVWHGAATPALGCEHHAEYRTAELIAAHNTTIEGN